jgi:hypothetical protein
MSEMVERVARAIANADDGTMIDPKIGWNDCDASMREDYRKEARAAIEAMREPTANMKDAVESNFDIQCELDDCNAHDIPYRSWGLMIDAALSGE